jgi:hypothetical protein
MDPTPSLLPPPPGGVPEVQDEPVPTVAPPSAIRAVIVVASVALVLAGVVAAGIWWLGGPGLCDASTVESARFGYCVAAPGWQLTNEATETELPYDELIKPADATTVRIVAIQLQGGQGLDFVVEQARMSASEDGLEVSEVVERRVAGVPAAQWDLTIESGPVPQVVREIVFVRGNAAWRVQMQTDAEGFQVRAGELEDILQTWTFR